jgi:hypothetical protein
MSTSLPLFVPGNQSLNRQRFDFNSAKPTNGTSSRLGDRAFVDEDEFLP